MSNIQLVDVRIQITKLSVTQADLWISASINGAEESVSLQGWLVGPKCPDRATIEIAYPLKAFTHRPENLPTPCVRVIIPEPCLWTEELPFTYQCRLELWQKDQLCDQRILNVRLTKSEK